MSSDELTLEDRVLALEVLLDAAIWGPHLADANHRKAIAAQLYSSLEASERHQSFPSPVQRWLYRCADGLSGADSVPGALRPVLRPFLQPDDDSK